MLERIANLFSSEPEKSNEDRITKALLALLKRSNPDAFVIFEEKFSHKFVQFAGSITEPLLFDLPATTLDEEEMARARALFRELGLPDAEEHTLYTDQTLREVADTMVVFNVELGRDIRRAVELTCVVFDRVYKFPPDFCLVVKEN